MKYKKGDIVKVTKSSYPAIIIKHNYKQNYLVSIREYKGDYCICEEMNINRLELKDYKIIYEIMNYGDWWISIHRDIFLNKLLRLI